MWLQINCMILFSKITIYMCIYINGTRIFYTVSNLLNQLFAHSFVLFCYTIHNSLIRIITVCNSLGKSLKNIIIMQANNFR